MPASLAVSNTILIFCAFLTNFLVLVTITNLVLGLTTGFTVLLGQYLGSKSYRDLSKMIGGAIVLFLIIALALTFVMLYFNNEITLLMNTPKEAIEATKS